MPYLYQGPQPIDAVTGGSGASNTTDLALAYSANVEVGDLLVATLAFGASAPAGITLTDSLGNTWTQITSQVVNSAVKHYVYYCLSAFAGACTVTLHSTTSTYKALGLMRWPGQATTALDTSATGSGTSAAPTLPSITVSAAGNLVLAFIQSSSTITNSIAPSLWTAMGARSGSLDMNVFNFSRVAPTTTPSATFALNTSMAWGVIAVSFANVAPAGGGGINRIVGGGIAA